MLTLPLLSTKCHIYTEQHTHACRTALHLYTNKSMSCLNVPWRRQQRQRRIKTKTKDFPLDFTAWLFTYNKSFAYARTHTLKNLLCNCGTVRVAAGRLFFPRIHTNICLVLSGAQSLHQQHAHFFHIQYILCINVYVKLTHALRRSFKYMMFERTCA